MDGKPVDLRTPGEYIEDEHAPLVDIRWSDLIVIHDLVKYPLLLK